jgi:preprotein translocase subunit YajC
MFDLLIGTAMAAGEETTQGQGGSTMMLFFGLIIAIWYFLVIRPQTKQARAHQQMVAALKKGDQVITVAGLHGRVAGVEESVVQVEVAKGVKVRIDKDKVTRIVTEDSKSADAEANKEKK